MLFSCATSLPREGYAECPVCKSKGDLACLYVKKKGSSHQVVEGESRVYFCSLECKKEYDSTNVSSK